MLDLPGGLNGEPNRRTYDIHLHYIRMNNIDPDANDNSPMTVATSNASVMAGHRFDDLMKRMSHIKAGRKFSRDDMNSNTEENSDHCK